MNKKYKNNIGGEIVTVVNATACGMCKRTIGQTMVIYTRKGHDVIFVMEYAEFYSKHSKL